ncbi:hypothetical protein GCM10027056_09240 [Glaciibacter psychrotolerans]
MRQRRRELSLNQEQVAQRAGLNVSSYARIDRGHGNPTFHTLIRLAGVLVIEPGELVAGFTAAHLVAAPDAWPSPEGHRITH